MSQQDDFIILTNVRVSFPDLFEPPIINGQQGKCGATLLLNPDENSANLDTLKKEITNLFETKFKGKKLPPEKLCLRKGEDKGRPEYEGCYALSASNRGLPMVLDARAQKVTNAANNPIYSGCYANAKVRLWAQDNNYGKRINCELIAIQFAGEGEPFDGTHVSEETAMEGFAPVGNVGTAANDDYNAEDEMFG